MTRAITLGLDNNLYFAGPFAGLPGSGAQTVARLTGSTTSTLGPGTDGLVYASLPASNGDVILGGTFHGMSGVSANRIARLSHGEWLPLDLGLSHSNQNAAVVYALAELANGDLIAGGTFTMAGSVAAMNIARWDGSQWWPLGPGLGGSTSFVTALAVLPTGDLIAGGQFQAAGQTAVQNVARWDGTAWAPIGLGLGGGGEWVRTLLQQPDGELVAGGNFTVQGLHWCTVARWTGTIWIPLQQDLESPYRGEDSVSALAIAPDGGLVAAGHFRQATGSIPGIAEWNGSSWSPLGSGITGSIASLAVVPGGPLLASGSIDLGPAGYTALAVWDGIGWSRFPGIPSGRIETMAQLDDGQLIIGGNFRHAGASISVNVARWKPGDADFNGDGSPGTDQDIEAFFSCLAGNCCPTCGSADFNADGDTGTDSDLESFFRVLAGGAC